MVDLRRPGACRRGAVHRRRARPHLRGPGAPQPHPRPGRLDLGTARARAGSAPTPPRHQGRPRPSRGHRVDRARFGHRPPLQRGGAGSGRAADRLRGTCARVDVRRHRLGGGGLAAAQARRAGRLSLLQPRRQRPREPGARGDRGAGAPLGLRLSAQALALRPAALGRRSSASARPNGCGRWCSSD